MSLDTLDSTNLGFRMVQDTIYDAKVFEGLVKAGILPQGFQVIKATVDLTGVIGASAPILWAHDGKQVQLAAGQQIAFFQGVMLEGAATLTSVDVGLSATDDGAVVQSLSTAGAPMLLIAINTLGDTFVNAANTSLVQTSGFLVAAVVGTAGAGVIQVVLVVV
jgi:hypothetical protein